MSNLEAMYRNGGVFADVCDAFAAYVMPIPDGPYQGGGASIRQWLMADSEDDCRENVERWLERGSEEVCDAMGLGYEHDWVCDEGKVLASNPVQYLWRCSKCGNVSSTYSRKQPPDKEGCPEPDACGMPEDSAPLDAEALREENGKCLALAEMLEERNVSLKMQVENLSKKVRDFSIDLADTEAELKKLRKENSELKEKLSNAKSALL